MDDSDDPQARRDKGNRHRAGSESSVARRYETTASDAAADTLEPQIHANRTRRLSTTAEN